MNTIQGRGLLSRGTTLIALQKARATLSRFHQTLACNGAYRCSLTPISERLLKSDLHFSTASVHTNHRLSAAASEKCMSLSSHFSIFEEIFNIETYFTMLL